MALMLYGEKKIRVRYIPSENKQYTVKQILSPRSLAVMEAVKNG
jgi:hypothetical protein